MFKSPVRLGVRNSQTTRSKTEGSWDRIVFLNVFSAAQKDSSRPAGCPDRTADESRGPFRGGIPSKKEWGRSHRPSNSPTPRIKMQGKQQAARTFRKYFSRRREPGRNSPADREEMGQARLPHCFQTCTIRSLSGLLASLKSHPFEERNELAPTEISYIILFAPKCPSRR